MNLQEQPQPPNPPISIEGAAPAHISQWMCDIWMLQQRRTPLYRDKRRLKHTGIADYEAWLVQSRGRIMAQPCDACNRDCGTYQDCVVIAADTERDFHSGSCANCRVNGKQAQCSFVKNGENPNGQVKWGVPVKPGTNPSLDGLVLKPRRKALGDTNVDEKRKTRKGSEDVGEKKKAKEANNKKGKKSKDADEAGEGGKVDKKAPTDGDDGKKGKKPTKGDDDQSDKPDKPQKTPTDSNTNPKKRVKKPTPSDDNEDSDTPKKPAPTPRRTMATPKPKPCPVLDLAGLDAVVEAAHLATKERRHLERDIRRELAALDQAEAEQTLSMRTGESVLLTHPRCVPPRYGATLAAVRVMPSNERVRRRALLAMQEFALGCGEL